MERAEAAEAAVARVRALCDRAEQAWENGDPAFEDPTPIPGWTTLVRRALDGTDHPNE